MVIVIMTAVMRGLMRTVPSNFVVPMMPLLPRLLLVGMLLLPHIRPEAAEDRTSQCAELIATTDLIADQPACNNAKSRRSNIAVALQGFLGLRSH